MQVIWSQNALMELREIMLSVATFAGINSARKYENEFHRIVALAADFPTMGKLGVEGSRELYPIRSKYRIVYIVSDDVLKIVSVKLGKKLHTSETFNLRNIID